MWGTERSIDFDMMVSVTASLDALWCSFSGRDAAGSGGARARARASRRARSGGKIGTGHTRRTRSSWASRHARATSAARLRPRGSVRRNTPVSPKPTSSSPVVATPRARGNAWVLSPAYLRQAPRSCFGGLRVTRRDEGSVRGCRVRSEWRAAARSIENVREWVSPKRGVTQSQKTQFAHPSQILRFCRLGFPCVELKLTRFRLFPSTSRSRRNRVFTQVLFSPTPSFVCVFSHVEIPKALVVYFKYVVFWDKTR